MANYNVQSTSSLYFNYHSTVWIQAKWYISTLKGFDMQWEIDSNDNGQPGGGSVTLYNIRPSLINQWKPKMWISIWAGPPDLFGDEGAGRITKISQNMDGKDKSVTINFQEYPIYNNLPAIKDTSENTKEVGKNGKKIYKTERVSVPHTHEKGTKKTGKYKVTTYTTKNKRVQTGATASTRHKEKVLKQVNHTFPKNVKAKSIIQWITKKAKIKLGRLKLSKNNTYKRGYTLSARPFQALQQLANDCDSKLYYRNNQLVIDNGADNNPFHEHIFIADGSGLIQQPVLSSKITKTPKQDQKTTQTKNQVAKQKAKDKQIIISIYTVDAWDDPRVNAGSYVRIQSKTLNNFCRVQSVKHQFNDDGYTMEMTVYA